MLVMAGSPIALHYQPAYPRPRRFSGHVIAAILLALLTWMPYVSGRATMALVRVGDVQIREGRRRGRRLVPLAVVLAWVNWIVSPVLVLMLTFTLTVARDRGTTSLSMTNLRNVTMNLAIYAQQNKGYLPADLGKMVNWNPNVAQFYRSPRADPAKPAIMLATGPCDYIYGVPTLRVSRINKVHLVPILYESPANYQNKKTLVGFADGHVEVVSGARMAALIAQVDSARLSTALASTQPVR